jgi:protein-disulfide isomerase
VSTRAETRRDRRSSGGGGSSGKLVWILAAVGVLGVALVLWNIVATIADESVRRPVEVVYTSPQELVDKAQGVSIGNEDAPITIMEFGDYQCPSCQVFWGQTKPILDLAYIETGQVRFVFHDFAFHEIHPHAFLAARAARCAEEQENFWPYHDRLFQEQATWSSRADPMNDFLAYAAAVGLNEGDFERCIKSDRHAELVSANRILGDQLGVTGTPTVFMDAGEGRPIPIQDWTPQGMRDAVDAALLRIAARNRGSGADTTTAEVTP